MSCITAKELKDQKKELAAVLKEYANCTGISIVNKNYIVHVKDKGLPPFKNDIPAKFANRTQIVENKAVSVPA